MAMLRMEARRMTPSDPQQARHRLFGNLHEPRVARSMPRRRRIRSCPYTFRITRLLAPAWRHNWHAALTQARVSKSGRCLQVSLSIVGRCLKDCIRPATVCQPPLR